MGNRSTESILRAANGVTLDPDLHGYKITSFVLSITELTMDSPGRNVNGDGIWTDITFIWEIEIFGLRNPTAANGPPASDVRSFNN